MTRYPRVRNGRLEGTIPFPHYVDEDEKVVWIYVRSSICGMAIPALMNRFYPDYEAKIPNDETWNRLQKKR